MKKYKEKWHVWKETFIFSNVHDSRISLPGSTSPTDLYGAMWDEDAAEARLSSSDTEVVSTTSIFSSSSELIWCFSSCFILSTGHKSLKIIWHRSITVSNISFFGKAKSTVHWRWVQVLTNKLVHTYLYLMICFRHDHPHLYQLRLNDCIPNPLFRTEVLVCPLK